MAGFIDRDECDDIVEVLGIALATCPENASALRAQLRGFRDEYIRARRWYDHAIEDDHSSPEFRAAGSLAAGEAVQMARKFTVRRVSDTGIEVVNDGRPEWQNIGSRTTPVIVVQDVEIDR